MPDPREAALQNIQDSSRAYGRGRRRGEPANVDPAFTAALELTDPEQRRAALSQYARQRAQGMTGGPPMSNGGNPLPSQASVMSQVQPPDRMQMAEDKMMQESGRMADQLGQRGGSALRDWQALPMPGAEDSPETHRFMLAEGREIGERDDDRRMLDDVLKYGTPDDAARYRATPMVGAEDSPEQHQARIVAGKQILGARSRDRLDEEADARDDTVIEANEAARADPLQGIGNAAASLEQQLMARRRRR